MSAPHLAVTILGSGLMRRLVTRMYFPGDPRNDADPLLRQIADEAVRRRLLARPVERPEMPDGALSLVFDIVLRGADETPFLAD
jgi:protocatechuate 3,4-dioxygenase alpha subunit